MKAVFFEPKIREAEAGIRINWPAIEKKRRKTQTANKGLNIFKGK